MVAVDPAVAAGAGARVLRPITDADREGSHRPRARCAPTAREPGAGTERTGDAAGRSPGRITDTGGRRPSRPDPHHQHTRVVLARRPGLLRRGHQNPQTLPGTARRRQPAGQRQQPLVPVVILPRRPGGPAVRK